MGWGRLVRLVQAKGTQIFRPGARVVAPSRIRAKTRVVGTRGRGGQDPGRQGLLLFCV